MTTDHRNRPPHPQGGQHRGSVGVSTWDGETDAERRERLRRGHEAVDAELWAAIQAEVNRAFGQPTSAVQKTLKYGRE